MRCSPGTRRVLQGRVPRAPKRTRPPALRPRFGRSISLTLSYAQRRHPFRRARPRPPTSVTPTRPRARRPSRQRAGRTLPTRRVRAMRSARPAFPHCAHSPPFSTRHLPAALHCIALGPPPGRVTALHAPEALWHCVRLAAATAVPRGRCEVLRQYWVLSSKCPAYHRGYREWSP